MQYTERQLQKIESNIWKYTVHLITNKRVFAAILSLYYLTIPNVEVQNIGWIMFCGSVASFLFELPTGYLSDKIGHKNTLIIGRLLLVASSLFFLFADGLTFLIIGAVCLSLSWAFFSGTGSAFMHDTLKALGKDNEYSKIMGKAASIGHAVPIVFMIIAPMMIEISYKMPFAFALFLDIIGLLAVISLRRVRQSEQHKKEVKESKLKDVFKESVSLGYMPFAILGAVISALIFIVQVYRGPYQEFIGADVVWFGVYLGLGRAIVSVLSAYSGKIKEYFNIFTFKLFQILIYSVFLFTIAFVDNVTVILIAFIICNGFQWGLGQVSRHFTLEIIGDSKFKATHFSISGQINQSITAVGLILMGHMINIFSYQTAFLLFAVVLLVLGMSLYFYILRDAKHRKYYKF